MSEFHGELNMESENKVEKYQEMLGDSQAMFILSMSEKEITVGNEKIYRPDSYSDLDNRGFMGGGHASCIAAAEIGQYFPDVKLVTTSGQEKTTDSLAKIYAEELKRLGVPEEQIIIEEKSKDTLTEMVEMVKVAKKQGWERVAVLTNENHVERASAILDNLGDVAAEFNLADQEFSNAWKSFAKGKNLKVVFIPTEEILPLRDSRYSKIVEEMRKSEAYKKRVESEKRGAEQVRQRTYGKSSYGKALKKEQEYGT